MAEPLRLLMLDLAFNIYGFFLDDLGHYSLDLHKELPLAAQVVILSLASDFAIYLIHRFQHFSPFYWKWHKLHHSSKELSSIATFRTHIVEFAFVQAGARLLIAFFLGMSEEAVGSKGLTT